MEAALSLFHLLPLQLRLEGPLPVSNVTLVSLRVDEDGAVSSLPALILLFQPIVTAVRAEKDVAGQALEHLKAMRVVAGDMRVSLVVHQLVAWIHIRAAYDDHMECTAGFGFIEGPGSGSSGVARCEVRCEDGISQLDRIAVVHHTTPLPTSS